MLGFEQSFIGIMKILWKKSLNMFTLSEGMK
jgi:hypothetical protein